MDMDSVYSNDESNDSEPMASPEPTLNELNYRNGSFDNDDGINHTTIMEDLNGHVTSNPNGPEQYEESRSYSSVGQNNANFPTEQMLDTTQVSYVSDILQEDNSQHGVNNFNCNLMTETWKDDEFRPKPPKRTGRGKQEMTMKEQNRKNAAEKTKRDKNELEIMKKELSRLMTKEEAIQEDVKEAYTDFNELTRRAMQIEYVHHKFDQIPLQLNLLQNNEQPLGVVQSVKDYFLNERSQVEAEESSWKYNIPEELKKKLHDEILDAREYETGGKHDLEKQSRLERLHLHEDIHVNRQIVKMKETKCRKIRELTTRFYWELRNQCVLPFSTRFEEVFASRTYKVEEDYKIHSTWQDNLHFFNVYEYP